MRPKQSGKEKSHNAFLSGVGRRAIQQGHTKQNIPGGLNSTEHVPRESTLSLMYSAGTDIAFKMNVLGFKVKKLQIH